MLRLYRVFAFLCLALMAQRSFATITVADTGEHFDSTPDRLVGIHWMEGYEYMARMQVLAHDRDLCPTDLPQNFTVSRPPDGLPVVLLVRGDYCSDYAKVQMAANNIQPPGVVRYLIIYHSVFSDMSHRLLFEDQLPGSQVSNKESSLKDTLPVIIPAEWNILSRHHGLYQDKIGVLHVSLQTGNELLRIIMRESQETRNFGGTRVLLDGASGKAKFLRNVMFWMGLSIMVSGCICSFVMSMRLNMIEGPQQPPQRPERRRLTVEQVETWLPEFVNEDEEEGHTECSICLDDYKGDEYMRRLPCGHQFHSDCVGRWLVERSATCPLCKFDLIAEEERDDDSDEEASINADDRSESGANRSSILQFLLGGTFPWRRNALEQREEGGDSPTDEENRIDPTPLLQDQDSVEPEPAEDVESEVCPSEVDFGPADPESSAESATN